MKNDNLKKESNNANMLLSAVTSDDREKDIQTICNHIITMSIQSTGDYGSGGQCPFCYKDCRWDANDVSEIEHESNCIYLIAKEVMLQSKSRIVMKRLDDLNTLIETTTLSKDWIEKTEAKPTKIALFCIKGKLQVIGIFWQGKEFGVWDDENAVSMTELIIDLPS